MAFSLTVNISTIQKITLYADCIDMTGADMDAPATPVWTNSNNAVATIAPAVDHLSCVVTAVTTGFTDVTVTVSGKDTTTRVVVGAPELNYVKVSADEPVAQ
jgi:hypothetical protein